MESAYRELRKQSRAGMKHALGPHTLALYERALLFRIYEHNVIPGLFQTAEYCAAMLTFWYRFLDAPNVSVGIVPLMTERAAVASAGFWMFDDDLVALEIPTAGIEVTRPEECALYARMFELLRSAAVHGPAARALVLRVLEEIGDAGTPSA